MTRLVDSRPPRSLKLRDSDEKPKTMKHRGLVVVEPEFFAQRESDGRLLSGPIFERVFSESLRDLVLERWDEIVLVARDENAHAWLEKNFKGNDEKVILFDIDPTDIMVSTQRLIELIVMQWTARVTLPRNRRTVSYLNLHRFVQCSSLQFAHTTSHTLLNVPVPKEKTFMERAEERARNGW